MWRCLGENHMTRDRPLMNFTEPLWLASKEQTAACMNEGTVAGLWYLAEQQVSNIHAMGRKNHSSL